MSSEQEEDNSSGEEMELELDVDDEGRITGTSEGLDFSFQAYQVRLLVCLFDLGLDD